MLRRLAVLSAFALAIPSLSSTANAMDGSSGCGPGWYVFKDTSLVSSALRSTTNSLLFPFWTLGMTFGTSNCTKHDIVLREKASLHFATMNYYELKGESAKGQGQYLNAFAQTIGCGAKAQGRFDSQLKAHHQTVFPAGSQDPEKTLLEVYKIIVTDPELTASCSQQVG